MLAFFESIGNMFFHLGNYILWLKNVFSKPEKMWMYRKETVRQMYDVGIGSVVIVTVISIFIGAVAALQFAYQLDGQLLPKYYIGYIVRDLAIIELSPTITCLVLAGKVGSYMATEIGGMRQKENIDAMEIMGVNTACYLVLPKIIASLIMIPLLVFISAFVAIIGGYIAVVFSGIVSHEEYLQGLRAFYVPFNIFMMLVKSLVFSFILTTISCYLGYHVKGGSIELGKTITRGVVISDILILLADYVLVVLLTS